MERELERHPVRLPVQYVNRPNLDFRGFAGTLASGILRVGDKLAVLPSGKESTVTRIVTFDGDLEYALPGQAITREWLMDMTAITYPYTTVTAMTGQTIKTILEDVADNLFNPDPYYQQGGDMVRVGGLQYRCTPTASMGQRIDELHPAKWAYRGHEEEPPRTVVTIRETLRGEPLRPSDIAVLTRSNDEALRMHRALAVAGLPAALWQVYADPAAWRDP